MSKKTISNLKSKEKQAFRANIKKYNAIINSSGLEESGVIRRTECGLSSPEPNNSSEFQNITPIPNNSQKTKQMVIQKDSNFNSPKSSSANTDVACLLRTIMENQNKLLAHQDALKTILQNFNNRLTILEAKTKDIIFQRSESMAQNTVLHECEVLTRGEAENEIAIEIASTLPIKNSSQLVEVEEKLQKLEYEMSMKAHIIRNMGFPGNVDTALRSLFTDAFIHNYNVNGNYGRLSLIKTHLVNKTLFDVFRNKKSWEFTKDLKRFVVLSHTRHNLRQNKGAKKPKHNT